MRHLVRIALFSTVLVAQTRAAVEYRCSAEDLEKFALECSSDRPCPVYLELSAADSATGRIFVTGNLHTESATLYSVLLASDDGGETWTEPHPRIPFTVLEQIQFVDLQNGWVSGQSVQNGPRDPFLLATSDGGKSWKQKPVSEEPRSGAVEQFWFDSRNTGVLLVDRVQANEAGGRHERYRTMTGGDSWALEEVSAKPLHLKRAGGTEPVFRVRPDGAAHAFRIEKNMGEDRWAPIAAFPIKAGECRGE